MHWVIRTKPHHGIYQWRGSNCKVIHWELLEAQSTLVNPMGSMKEPWKPGNGTTFSSPLFGVSTYVQLLILFYVSFLFPLLLLWSTWMELGKAWCPLSLIFLWSPQGRNCFPHFINEETEPPRRYIWTASLTSHTPAAAITSLKPCS